MGGGHGYQHARILPQIGLQRVSHGVLPIAWIPRGPWSMVPCGRRARIWMIGYLMLTESTIGTGSRRA